MLRISSLLAAVVLAIAAVLPTPMGPGHVAAQNAPNATLYVVAGNIPSTVTTASQLLRHARSHRARQVAETTGVPMDQRHWRGSIVLAFSGQISVRNLNILVYDVTDGRNENTGNTIDIFVHDPHETNLVTQFDLPRTRFRPDERVRFVLTAMRREIGRAEVTLTGERRQGNGSVDFTQDNP